MPDDIIDDLLRELRPHVTLDEWHRKAYELRQKWGGCEVYIRKAPAEGKAHRLASVLAVGGTLREAFDAAGIRKSQGYVLASRRTRR